MTLAADTITDEQLDVAHERMSRARKAWVKDRRNFVTAKTYGNFRDQERAWSAYQISAATYADCCKQFADTVGKMAQQAGAEILNARDRSLDEK